MRLKTLGVMLVTATALFIMFFWLTDEPRREAIAHQQEEHLIEYGLELFGPLVPPLDFAADCASCHGEDGSGGDEDSIVIGPSLRSQGLANRARIYEARTDLNYIETVILRGGVAVSGNPESPMPAWEHALNTYQVEALVALIESWLEEPDEPIEVPDTVEAGREVYLAHCAACHLADLTGGAQFPDISNIHQTIGDDLVTDIANLDQLQAEYEEDPRQAIANWVRANSQYNDGERTLMPEFSEDILSESELTALITYLLEGEHAQ
jgi:mono/diheme cytochrome c family protein